MYSSLLLGSMLYQAANYHREIGPRQNGFSPFGPKITRRTSCQKGILKYFGLKLGGLNYVILLPKQTQSKLETYDQVTKRAYQGLMSKYTRE